MPIKVHKFSPRQNLPSSSGGLYSKYKRLFDDEEYRKLVAEQGQTIAELGEDTIETVGANLYEGTKATPEAMYQTGTELYEFGAELFGAGEDTMYDARQARRAAQELSAQTKQELVGDVPGGGISEFGYELGSTGAQEIPFMIGSAGVGTVAKKAGQKIVKNKIRQRLGQEALEAAPDTFVGRAVGKAIQDQTEKIGTRAAISSMAAIHGARSTSGTFGAATDKLHEDYSKALKAQNPDMPWQEIDRMAYEQARADAVAPAVASGVITAGLISAFGATGVERFFANPTKSRPVFQEFLSAFGMEATEEGADQFLQGVLAKHSYDPSRSWDSIMAETAHAGLLGGTIGVKLGGTKILAERGVDFYQNAPISNRLANWLEERAGKRVKDKEGIAKWIENHTDTSGTEAKEAATAIASAVDQIKARLNKESQGASEREAKSEAAQEQRPTEEELDQREEQGEDVTVERDVAEELNQHKARGRAAAEDKVENPEEIASQIEEEDSIEAAEKFVEGYNEVAIKEESEQEEFRSEDLDQDYFDTFPGAEEEVTTEQSAVTEQEDEAPARQEDDPNQEDFFGLMLAPAAEQIATKDETDQADVENDSMDLFDQAQQQVVNEDRDVFGPPVEGAQRELDLTELEEGEERGRVDVPQRPLGPPAPDPQRDLVVGEETEPDFTTENLEAKEAPEDQFVLSIERPSKSRLSHYQKADGYYADEYIHVGKKFADNGREVIVKHNQNTKSIDIGFFNEQGRFIPTHRLKDYSQVKESNQKRGNSQQPRAYFIPKQLLSDKNLANTDVWELAPRSPIQAKFEKAQAAQVGESEMARRIVSNVSDPVLRETLQLMLANGQLGVESVNALILAANQYKPKGAKRVNPRALADRGDAEGLAENLEQSISLLRDKNLFSQTVKKGDAGFTEEAVNSLVAGLEARTDLTVNDLKLVDKGRADEEFLAAEFEPTEVNRNRGFRASVKQSNKRDNDQRGLAQVVNETTTTSEGAEVKRVEVELVNPERIPLTMLTDSMNALFQGKGIEFAINKSGDKPTLSVSGKTEALDESTLNSIRGVAAHVSMKAKNAEVNSKYQAVLDKIASINRPQDKRKRKHGEYKTEGLTEDESKATEVGRRGKKRLTENDKKVLEEGGAIPEWWAGILTPSKLGKAGADRIQEGPQRGEIQPALNLFNPTGKKPAKINKVTIEKSQLDEGVERYSIDGRQVFIIKDKRDGRYYYTIGSRPSTENIGVAMDATVKTPLQAKNFIVGQINNLNKELKLAPLSLLIGKARDTFGQEQQQAVEVEAAEGEGESVETRGRWRSKVQPSEPMPQVEGVERQDPNEPASYKTGREMPKGFVLERGKLIPAAKQFDNDFRASVGLPPVTKQGGRYALPSSPLELTEEQRDPQSVPVVGQRYTEIMEGSRDEGTPLEERLAQTDLPPAAAESEIDLSEEEFDAVKAHTDSFNGGVTGFINSIVDEVFDKNPVLFAQLQKLALTAQKAATKFVADARKRAEEMDVSTLEGRTQRKKLLDRAAILEAGMPYDFKSVLNEQGRRILISWAKSVSPNNHKAVLEYAEDIFRAAETNKKLRAKAKKSDSENLQVPTDLPTAKGAVALKELIARPDNGLTEEQRLAALRFLDQIAPELLENLSLNISAELNAEGDTEVAYEGEFNSLENLINLASDTNTDENTLLEEIAHFTAKLLPSDLRSQAIKLHKKALGDEIAKNEKALSRAQGDDRVRILSNLNVLRAIQSRGQLTSEEFRNILPRESEVGSDTFERIIEDTYHLANADEFYANAMVTRAGESEFSRARQFLNSILDAIAAAFGNTNAQVNRFVSNAKRSLATPGKANKRMGGMLMRGNINAKSMKVLTNPGKLAGATATDLQRADQARAMGNEADAEKYKQRADDRVAQAGGVVSLFERVIRKVVPTLDTEGRVAQLLKFRDLGYVTNLVDSLPSSSEYKQTIQRFMEDGKPELAQATALYAYQFILEMENRAKALRLKADEKLKRINTDTFKDNVRRAIENEKKDNRTAIINSEIVKSLQNALVDATSTGPTLNMLAQMIGSVENLEAAVSTVPELNKAIATLTNILSKEEAGIELFNRPDISDQFHDSGEIVRLSNEIFEFVKNLGVRVEDENLWRTASALFVANRSIRTNSIIESMPFIEAKKNSTAKIKEILDAINSGDEATRRQKIAEIFQEVVDLSTEEGKAKYVTQQRMGSVVKEIRDAAIYEEAAAAAEAVVNDPEITEFRRLTALQAKVDDRPELVENHFYEDFSNGSIYIPKPPNKLNPEGDNVVKINVISGGKGNENIKKANEAAKDIQEWLEENMDDEGNPTSPYWEYYWNTLQQLHNTFVNDLIWNTPTSQRTVLRNTFFGVLGHMVDNLPTRGAKIARRFIDKHDMYYTWFDDWRARHKAKWTNLLLLAAKSRKGRFADDVKFFKLRESKEAQKIRGVAEWEKNVGRYLRDSWQEGGMNYGVGEVLPNGEIVTKEDMALLEYEDMMTDEAYQFNEKIAEQDESTQPFRVTDAAVKGRSIKRLALRRGKAMLPRRFSGDGRSFIDQYQLQVNAGKTGKALFDEIFAGEEGTQALISFISDRNPEWVTASGIDASINEGIYSMVSEEIRDGSLLETYNETELTAQLIASRLAEAAGVGVETGTAEVPSIKEQLMQEFAPVLDNLAGKFDKENNNKNPFLQISTTEGISSLTEGRRDKIAPSFFYTYGFNNEQQFQSFVSQGQLPAAQGVISALKSAQTEIGQLINTSQLDALAKKYMNQLGKKGKKADRYSRKVQKAIAKELGIKIVSDNSVQFQLTKQYENLGQYIRDFEEVYGSAGGSDYSVDSLPNLAQRAWGVTVGSLLANPMTTIRNYTDTLINGALAVQMIQGGTGIMPIIHTILRSLMVSVIKGGGSFIVSGAKIATYKLPIVGTWKAVKRGTGIDGHPPSLYGAIRALLTPTIEELAETLPSRTREYEMLRRQGLGMPTTPEQTSINFDELLETGGRILSPMQAEESSKLNPAKALFWRGLGKGIGAWEAGLNVLLRPLMQRMGDVAANNLLANLAAHVGHTMQRKAKLAYANRIKQGINLDETLEPEELLGNFMGLLKQNGTTYNEALTFLSKAGVTNLEEQVKDYWQRLASAPDKASRNQEKLFTQSQLDRMAAVLVMSNNIATPSNRPLWMKKSRLNSIMFALTGWSFNQLQNWMKATAATGGESGWQAKRRVQMLMLIMAPIAFGIPDNWILEWLMRGVDEGLYGRRRITRLPNETAGWQQDGIQWDETKAVLSLATQSVPLLGSSLNAYWNDLPGRAQHTPAGLVTGQLGAAVDFFVNGKSTGNLEQTGIAAINRLLPISRAVTYRVSKWQKAKTKNDNARRAIRATYSDAKAIRPITGGAMGYVPDEFTPLKEMWAAAVADGDWAEARRLYDEGIDTYRYVREEATGRKISREQAERNMKSSLSTANPVAKALQYKPDRKTFYENIAHATEKDAGTIRSNLKNWEEAHRIFDLTSIFASGSSKSKRPVVRRSINRINRRTSGRSALRQR